jgi:asparagine synthase (glutamine-hydrolysing)
LSGIVAIVNFDGAPIDPQVLRAMAEQCAYRGPDGIRYWIRGNVGLAHLALHATPEALRELQPQLSEDGMLCLTADVRVDNRPELIHLLAAKGEPVTSASTDADLLLAAYRIWGEACPAQIIGDYAFAIWDARAQRLFCARDVYGVKSLHYARVGSMLCVASEGQQIIQHPAVPRRLDEVTVADFLVRNYNDEGRTMFQDVWAVRRAHYLVADPSGQRMERYWDIDPDCRITYKSDEEYAAHFLEIFQRVVADHLRTQSGTVGITMSGGMDSTSVAAIAQKIINSQSGQPHLLACSYAFEHLKECDETCYSRAMADELGIELVYIPAENFWYLDDDEAFTPSLETPFMAEESVTRNILGTFKERGARVWLTGHGGDSLVAGSSLVLSDRLRHGDLRPLMDVTRYWKRNNLPISRLWWAYRNWFIGPMIPTPLKKMARKLRKSEIPDWLEADFAHRTRIVERLSSSRVPRRFNERARQDNYSTALDIDPIQMSINRAERLGALLHMEARHPFLDRRLAQFLMSIPAEQLFRAGAQKFILRNAMHGILPEVIRTRLDKTEFSRYIGIGLRYKETEKIRALITTPLLSTLHLVYLVKLQYMYKRYISQGKVLDAKKSWSAVSLELWLRKYLFLFNYHGEINE